MKYGFLLLLLPQLLVAQGFTSYFSGDTSDVNPTPMGGICLMGGATEDDNAMRWFLQRANGGDVVVIRASGADGYNDYLYSELGVAVNSVETILMPNANSALDPYIAQQVRNAEALWIAGGDQSRYISYWRDQQVEDALRYLIHEKKAVIGGTSAGMAVLSEAYFRASFGTVTSAEALANPFNTKVDIGYSDFLDHPLLKTTITDTHYDSPDRRGRHFTFLARMAKATGLPFKGIAAEEYTAICIDTLGLARVYGGQNAQDYAYFLQVNCTDPIVPETCSPFMPLHWVRDSQAVKVCKIKGTPNGSNTFDLRDWHTTAGGTWQNWWSENGQLKTANTANFEGCTVSTQELTTGAEMAIFPNPAGTYIQVIIPVGQEYRAFQILDLQGKIWHAGTKNQSGADWENANTLQISTGDFPKGLYMIRLLGSSGLATKAFVVH